MIALRVQIVRYFLVGLVNTAVGLACIYLLMFFGAGHLAANAFGFLVGLAISYVLNGKWTFRVGRLEADSLMRFWLVVAAAYLANAAVLLGMLDVVGAGPHVSQLAGVSVYSVFSFVGLKFFAFGAGGPKKLLPTRTCRESV